MLNKTKIEWCDYSWNVITGCKRGCSYCYAKKMRARFMPEVPWDTLMYFDERLEDPIKIKKPSKIFVGSMSDIEWWGKAYMGYVLETIGKCPQHTFLFLTKNDITYERYSFPKNCWLGVTNSVNACPSVYLPLTGNISFMSYEPIIPPSERALNSMLHFDWIILGGLTPKPLHKKEWVDAYIERARQYGIPIFLKNNLHYPIKIQEFPITGGSDGR